MVGAAIAVGRGILPPFIIRAALDIPFQFKVPIVPANGLFLNTAGFERANMVSEGIVGYGSVLLLS